MLAAAHRSDHLGSCAMLEPAMQHVCHHHMQLPAETQAERAQQRFTSCSACFQPFHRPPEAEAVSPSFASAGFGSSSFPSSSAPPRAATALASRAIKQRAASPSSPSAMHSPEVTHSQCHVCNARYKAADAASTGVMAASWSQQEHCCDCGYVTKSPRSGPFKLGLARPASAGGRTAVRSAASRPLSADVGTAAGRSAYRSLPADGGTAARHSACRPLSADTSPAASRSACSPMPADVIRAVSHSACRPLPDDVIRAVTPAACRPSSDDVRTAANHSACRRLSADVIRAASPSACKPQSAGVDTCATPSACRPLPADVSTAGTRAADRPLLAAIEEAGKASTQSAAAVGLDGAVGDMLSQSLRSAAALTPVTKEQQGYRSPLSHLQQSFKLELGIPSSLAARVDEPVLEAGQGQHTRSSAVGSCCSLHDSGEVAHNAAAAHLVHQDGTLSHDTDLQVEVSPETSFLQMLDQCQQTDPDSLRVKLDQQQQTDASSATMADMPDCAKHSGCWSPLPVHAMTQQQVKARTLRSFKAQPQATAVATSGAPASTAVAAEPSEAFSSGLAVIQDDSDQGSHAAHAAGQLLQQDELCQLGAIIADRAQNIQPRPHAGSLSHLFGVGMPLHLQSAPPASGLPSTSEGVTMRASGIEDSVAGHAGCHASPTAADTSEAQAMSLPAVSAPDVRPRSCAAWQLETHVDNAPQPALQTLHAMMAHCSSSQGVPLSSGELGAVQQQQHPERVASAHAENEHKAGSTDAVDVGVETDHRWLLSTAWAEQRQWIAARRCSGEADAKWELDESGSVSGDSEGSVSSESTLRPSSVGRCRVNCGRNAKVPYFASTIWHHTVCLTTT